MLQNDNLGIWLKILLPGVLAALLLGSPTAGSVQDAVQMANIGVQPRAGALVNLAELETWRTGLWEQAARIYQQNQDVENANLNYQKAQRHNDLSPTGQMSWGEMLWQAGRVDEAVKIWQSLLDSGKAPIETYPKLAQIFWARGNTAQVADLSEKWRKLEPSNQIANFYRGLSLIMDHSDQAVAFFSTAAQGNEPIRTQAQTIRQAINLASLQKDPAVGLVVIGRGLGSAGQWKLAQLFFEDAVQIAPDEAEGWAFLGEARQQNGLDGFPQLQKAIQLNPDSGVNRGLLGLYYRRQGKPELAFEVIQAVVLQEPLEPGWQVELGNTVVELGKLEDALSYFEKAARLAPTNPFYWEVLARFSVETHTQVLEVGLPAARQAVQLAPNDSIALDLMGWVFYQVGDQASAERFLLKSLAQDGESLNTYLHLGQTYIQMGRMPDAFKSLVYVQQNASPESQEWKIALRLLQQYFSWK